MQLPHAVRVTSFFGEIQEQLGAMPNLLNQRRRIFSLSDTVCLPVVAIKVGGSSAHRNHKIADRNRRGPIWLALVPGRQGLTSAVIPVSDDSVSW